MEKESKMSNSKHWIPTGIQIYINIPIFPMWSITSSVRAHLIITDHSIA